MTSTKKLKYKTPFKKYFDGEESLSFSFWVVTVLGLSVLSIPNFIILSKGDEFFNTMSDTSALFYIAYLFLSFAVAIYVYIGLWKCASKYIITKKKNKESATWGYLSYVYIIVSVIRGVSGIIFG